MSEAIQVSIGAKIDELITEFQKAAAGIQTSAQQIGNHVATAMDKVQQSSNEATAALRRTEQEASQASQGMMGSFGRVTSFLSGAMGGILAGFSIKKVTDEVIEFADEAEKLSNTAQIVGMTASALSRLHNVAEPMAISGDAVDTAMKKLAKTMVEAKRGGEEAAQAFEAVGIHADELKNMSIDQVLAKIADKYHTTADGADKAASSMMLLGKSGSELIPMLNQGSEEMTKLGDAAAATGAAMSDDMVSAGLELDSQLDALGQQAKGLKNVMAQGLAPALGFIASMFTDGSSTATDFGGVFKGVATIVIAATSIIRAAWEVVSSIVRGIAVALTSIVTAIARAATMDFSGAKAALSQGKDMVIETFTNMNDNITKLQEKTKTAVGGIWSATKKPPGAGVGAGADDGSSSGLDFADKGGGSDGKAAAAKKAAEDAKRAAREAFDYQMELLRNEMAALEKGSEDKIALAKQMTEKVKAQFGAESTEYARAQRDQVRITEEVENEKRRIKDMALTKAKEHAQLEISLEKGKADYLVATGQMSAIQRAQVERNAEESQYAMQMSYFQQRLALMATEPAEIERINQEIERLEGEHQLRMQGLDMENFQVNKAQWDGYFQSITDGFGNAIQGMVFQGQTLQQAMGGILQNILGSLIQTGVKMLANWAATQLGMTAATVTGAGIRTAAEVASAKQSTMANAGAAIKNIMTKAAEVFANVYNAIAGIPYVGPFLAPVMAVAAGAVVIGMVGKVASAEGGWDRVPYDGAQAILHKEEMVLPGPLAEGIRAMVESGQRGGGLTVNALDRRDVQRFFDDNSDIYMRALTNNAANNPGGF